MNKNALYLTFKLAALMAVTANNISANADSLAVVSALALCCLFLTGYLINRLCRKKGLRLACPLLGIGACFAFGAENLFPVLLPLIFELVDLLDAKEYFYKIAAVLTVLSALIFQPRIYELAVGLLITVTGAFARLAIERVEYFRELSEKQRKEISAQNERIKKLQTWSAALRDSVSLEERSRFSTRIHDKLGHGISGSIILLEVTKLKLHNDPEQAEKSLCTAIENLRASVDSIREALHEERPNRGEVSAAELKEMLERFAANYEIKTEFSFEGNADRIQPQIWLCLKENLTEALTNTVKHSSADKFELKIRVFEKMIRAEFSDNGASSGFSKGMGLEAIEDRTAVCGGKTLFQSGAGGFKIINIFGVKKD